MRECMCSLFLYLLFFEGFSDQMGLRCSGHLWFTFSCSVAWDVGSYFSNRGIRTQIPALEDGLSNWTTKEVLL